MLFMAKKTRVEYLKIETAEQSHKAWQKYMWNRRRQYAERIQRSNLNVCEKW